MKALRYADYLGPLAIEDVDIPSPGAGEVRIKVHAASVNPYDVHFYRGRPTFMRLFTGLRKPGFKGLGRDVAGVVDAVGNGVTDFQIGDEVYGGAHGAFAEFAIGRADELITKPEGLTYEQAAAIPMAAFTGLQGLDAGGMGKNVLVNGASGGIGHFTVQLAIAMGATVTGVCKTDNVPWVQALGCKVVDYEKESMAQLQERFDIIIDPVSNHTLKECKRLLTPNGRYVWLGSANMGPVMGPLGRIIRIGFAGKQMRSIDAKRNRAVMERLNEFIVAGQLAPYIEHTFELQYAADALAHVATGHTKGKTVITVRHRNA